MSRQDYSSRSHNQKRYDSNQISMAFDVNKDISTKESYEISYTEINLKVQKVFADGHLYLVKYYSFAPSTDVSPIIQEIKLIEKLKSSAIPENCFLSNITYVQESDSIKITTEIYQNCIQEFVSRKIYMADPLKIAGVEALLRSFAFMVDLNICYSDISSTNILITPDSHLKLNYFIPDEIERKFNTPFIEGQRITGSKAYLSPDLLELSYRGVDFCQFNPEKAQVYSLGLCIYELFANEESIGLNIPSNSERLNEKIASLPNEKVRKLLGFMLNPDSYSRPTFRECLAIFEVNTLQQIDDIPRNLDRNAYLYAQDIVLLKKKILLYKNPPRNLEVWQESTGDYTYIVKAYSDCSPKRLELLRSEVDILVNISERSSDDNLFIKLLFWKEAGTDFFIATEKLGFNMMNIITAYPRDHEINKFIAGKLLRCFSELEKLNILHRDIKPHNILLTEQYRIKLVSYRCAKMNVSIARIIGDENYLPPELKPNRKYKAQIHDLWKSEIFALGMTLFQLFTRITNIQGCNNPETIGQMIDYFQTAEVPEPFKSIITNMLSIEPNDRKSFTELEMLLSN